MFSPRACNELGTGTHFFAAIPWHVHSSFTRTSSGVEGGADLWTSENKVGGVTDFRIVFCKNTREKSFTYLFTQQIFIDSLSCFVH